MKKHFFKLEGFEVFETTAKIRTDGRAYIYPPSSYGGKKVAIVRLE